MKVTISPALGRSKLDCASEHLRSHGLCEKQLATALGMKNDQSLRQRRLRLSKPAKRSRDALPLSFKILGMRWTLIGDVEECNKDIVEAAGGAFDPEMETKEAWIARFRQAHIRLGLVR